MSELDLFSARFRAEREGSWRKLEQALSTLQSAQASKTAKAEAALALPTLAQDLNSALSVARSISLDRSMITYLESLASRTSLMLNDEQPPLGAQVARFFTHIWPQTMRALGWDMLLSVAIFFAGLFMAIVLFSQDPEWYYAFIGGDARNPDASTEYLASTLYDDAQTAAEREIDGELTGAYYWDLAAFAAFLFQNNFYVSILALAGGLLFGSITLWVLFFNGLYLGVFVALFFDRDLGTDVVGWLSIHGVTELGAIIISGAGGLLIGRTMIFVKGQSLASALRAIGPKIAAVALAMLLMLTVAALVEGFLRQTVNSMTWRYIIGWGLGLLWAAYFIFAGRTARG